jgi:hypothetical protein
MGNCGVGAALLLTRLLQSIRPIRGHNLSLFSLRESGAAPVCRLVVPVPAGLPSGDCRNSRRKAAPYPPACPVSAAQVKHRPSASALRQVGPPDLELHHAGGSVSNLSKVDQSSASAAESGCCRYALRIRESGGNSRWPTGTALSSSVNESRRSVGRPTGISR